MTGLTAAYKRTDASVAAGVGLQLYQAAFSSAVQAAGSYDLAQMWQYVRAGLSARLYKAASCPASVDSAGVVTVPVDFWAFPTELGLNYKLSAALGTISEPVQGVLLFERDLVFDQTDSMELDYLIGSMSCRFESQAYNEYGQQVPLPAVSFDGRKVTLSKSCFVILRAAVYAVGYRYTCTMQLNKYEQTGVDDDGELIWAGYSIDNLDNTIQATWYDGETIESDSLDLEIPACVSDYLSTCGDTGDLVTFNSGDDDPIKVWYNTCTGQILGARRVEND